MLIAAFIIAVLALIVASVSLTIVLINKKSEKREELTPLPPTVSAIFDPESLKSVSPFEKDPTKSLASPSGKTIDDHFNDAFAASDEGFTGIDESFGV